MAVVAPRAAGTGETVKRRGAVSTITAAAAGAALNAGSARRVPASRAIEHWGENGLAPCERRALVSRTAAAGTSRAPGALAGRRAKQPSRF